MSNFDFESFSEGDWEDKGDLAWNEFDWERYLRSQDKVFQRYLELYAQLKGHPERLDRVAQMMGWDTEDWAANDYLGDDDSADVEESAADDDGSDLDPYTLHKHPIFIATKALYLDVQARWLDLLADGNVSVPPAVAAGYQASLAVGESNSVAAVHSLDMGDYALAVCLFKRSLADLNRSFQILAQVAKVDSDPVERYRKDATCRLFDLREIWLRVMQYCREELDRRIRDDD